MIMQAKHSESEAHSLELIPRHYLLRAWENAAVRKSAPGIDGVNVAAFSRKAPDEIKRLYLELNNHTYKPRPMLSFEKKKPSGGIRKLAIPCLRDKVVARAESELLSERFDSLMAPQSYAYRTNKGALKAVAAAENYCRKAFSHIVRIDINDFFGSLDHQLLWAELAGLGIAEDEIELLMRFASNPLFDGVRTEVPRVGVPQGTPLAPVLANLYLRPFDRKLNDEKSAFIRYADDIVIFGRDLNEAGNLMNFAVRQLNDLKLSGNEDKDRIYEAETGFPFLGFTISTSGRVPGTEAVTRLEDKLAADPFADEDSGEYAFRRNAIIRGWNNYFTPGTSGAVPVQAGPEDSAMVADDKTPETEIEHELAASRDDFNITLPDSAPEKPAAGVETVISSAEERYQDGDYDGAMWRLRQALADDDILQNPEDKTRLSAKLAEMLARRGLYGAAAQCGGNKNIIHKTAAPKYGQNDIELWRELFSNPQKNDPVYLQYVDRLGRHGYKPAQSGLTPDALQRHWEGRHTLAVPVFDQHNHVRFGIIDFDVSRKSLDTMKLEAIEALKEQLLDDAGGIARLAGNAGIESILEESGYKGYHLWFFFHTGLNAGLVKTFLQSLCRIAGQPPEGTHRELFPAADEYVEDNPGTRIKLPLGVHQVTGNRSKFLLHDRSVCENPLRLLHSKTVYNSAEAIRRAIAGWNSRLPDGSASATECSASIASLFEKCAVLNALRNRAQSEHNLTHYERCILRGVLAPLGEDGRREIHRIMSGCSNYSRDYTGKMISGESRSPISCNKIREMLGLDADKIGCSCKFKPRKNYYANPLRHLSSQPQAAKNTGAAPAALRNSAGNSHCNAAADEIKPAVSEQQSATNSNITGSAAAPLNPSAPSAPAARPRIVAIGKKPSLWQRISGFKHTGRDKALDNAGLHELLDVYQQKRRELVELQERIAGCSCNSDHDDIIVEFTGPDSRIQTITVRYQ